MMMVLLNLMTSSWKFYDDVLAYLIDELLEILR